MTSDKLQQARSFETQYAAFIPDAERPAFHVTGAIGWINDPNGFSCYKGEYHLFFQYHPYSTEWGPMHWGHVKTRDFIRWERLPAAIAPDTDADRDGCFSGSAVELPDGRQMLMYTGVYRVRRPDGRMEEFQQQCVAFGDGVDYEKYASAIPSSGWRRGPFTWWRATAPRTAAEPSASLRAPTAPTGATPPPSTPAATSTAGCGSVPTFSRWTASKC